MNSNRGWRPQPGSHKPSARRFKSGPLHLRLAFTLTLVASLASLGAEPAEAISFDRPIRVINERNEVRWSSDGGTCLSPPAWAEIDAEFVRLQTSETQHKNEPSPAKWFFAGAMTGATIATVIAVAAGVYLVTR